MSPSRRGGALLLALVLVGVAAWAVALRSPLFDVRRVEVRGNGRLTSREVRQLVTGVEGRNLLLLPLEGVERSAREHPWIADARARRELPGTIVLEIEERLPVAWVRDPSGGAAVAADGTVLQRRARPAGLAVIGAVEEAATPGSITRAPRPTLRVVASLPPAIRREVAAAMLEGEGVVLRTRSGARILYGRAEALGAKRATLGALLDWMAANEVPGGVVDLRAPATPAIRPAAGG